MKELSQEQIDVARDIIVQAMVALGVDSELGIKLDWVSTLLLESSDIKILQEDVRPTGLYIGKNPNA